MKKLLLTLSGGLFFCASSQAQIVLNSTNVGMNPTGTDTIYNAKLIGLPSLNIGTNTVWDLSGIQYNPGKYLITYNPVNNFAGATHTNLAYYNIAPGLVYQTSPMFTIDAGGQKIFGERLTRQAFPLGAQTGNSSDSLIVNAQDVRYSAPHTVLAFPATYQRTWSSVYKDTTALTVKVTPFYNNAPAQKRSTINTSSNVRGWGKAKVRMSNGQTSGAFDVLQVEVVATTEDSFYLNGMPAPPALLAMTGLTQPNVSTVYQRNFYRAYEVQPVVSVTYTDNSYTTIQDLNVLTQRVPFAESINDVADKLGLKIYPNPVTNHTVSLSIAEAKSGKWSYDVINVVGQNVASATLDFSNKNDATIQLPETLTAGNYFLRIYLNGEPVGANQINIAE